MINIAWLPVDEDAPVCGQHFKRRKENKITCELPPEHKTVYVGGLLYPMHLGRDAAGRWRSW